MKRLRIASITALLLIAAMTLGCGQAIKVNRAKYDTVPAEELGIPFYVKTSACEQQTVWLQPIYTLTLKATATPQPSSTPATQAPNAKSEPTVLTRTVTLTLKEFRTVQVAQLYAAVNSAQKAPLTGVTSDTQIQDIEDKWQAVVNLAPPDPFTVDEDHLNLCVPPRCDNERVIKVANSTSVKVFVDYTTMYFYNVAKPLAGSSQASLKLASDGTMTEGSAQIESKTLQTFLDLLPVKEVLTAVAKTAGGLKGLVQVPPTIVKFELTSDVKTYKHTHSAYVTTPATTPTVCAPPAGDLLSGYNLMIEDVTESKKKAEGADQTISVSGSIQLPKPKEEPKK
ncbi:MAG TPA: hypothetical protein VEV41_19630 [Terriglobales bacterium]|nr:hypothetical protein [Terriglobales bacterium]